MPKYECTVIFDASSSVTVEAETPEEAARLAQDMTGGDQSLCHQCANHLQTGDSLGVHVYNEECTEQLLDTTYQPQRTWVGLDFDTIEDCFGDGGYSAEENGILVSAQWLHDFAHAIEAKLKEKNT